MLIFVELQPIGVGVSGVSGVPAIFDISALHSLTSLRLNLSVQTAKAPTRSCIGFKSFEDHGFRHKVGDDGHVVTLASSLPFSVSLVPGCHWCPETSGRGGRVLYVVLYAPRTGYPLWNSLVGFPAFVTP